MVSFCKWLFGKGGKEGAKHYDFLQQGRNLVEGCSAFCPPNPLCPDLQWVWLQYSCVCRKEGWHLTKSMSLAPSQRRQRTFIIYCCLVQVLPVRKPEACLWWQIAFNCACLHYWGFPPPPQVVLHCFQGPWGRRKIKPQQAKISAAKACSAFPENTIWNIFYFEWLTSRPKLFKRSLKTFFFF